MTTGAVLPPPPESPAEPPSPGSTVRRAPGRARYDRDAVHAVLDAGWLAHVGLVVDGDPVVIPMVYARDGERLLLHGSVASRLMRGAGSGLPVSIAVTHLDGLVLARSAFHHSVNYRSVVVRGRATRVTDPAEMAAGFARLVDHAAPGRSGVVREVSDVEARQTMLLSVPLDDAAVKSRRGDPIDEDDDLDLPVWAGVVPLRLVPGEPVASADLVAGELVPPGPVTTP